MAEEIRISISDELFLKDPGKTILGRKFIRHSIEMIDELGFEAFTFKKLAIRAKSTEASIYRYFPNKHGLLVYLVSWYWEWVSFQLEEQTKALSSGPEKLKTALTVLVDASFTNPAIDYVDEQRLHRIVIAEGMKVYHTKNVDEQNQKGYYASYKRLVRKLADLILEVKPFFPYPVTLAGNLIGMAGNQIYLARHLPSLTEVREQQKDREGIVKMMEFYLFKLLD